MIIRRNLIEAITLIVIQLSFIIAQDNYESKYSQINLETNTLPLRFKSLSANSIFSGTKRNPVVVTRRSREIDPINALHQEIDQLTSHIQNITNDIKQKISNAELYIKKRRSSPLPGFNRPSTEDKLKSLESKLKSMLTVIETMKNSTENSETSERLGNLETATENLQKFFDDTNRKTIAQMSDLEVFVNKLTATVDDVKQQLDVLQQHFNEKLELEKPKLLRSEIIEDIKGRDFAGAVEKLRNLTGGLQKNINIIVHEVYANQAGNFDLILLFGDNEDMKIKTSVAVYQALTFEMESNEHSSYMKLLKLIDGLNDKINHPSVGPTSQTFSDAVELKRKLRGIVKNKIGSKIVKAATDNDYQKVSEIFAKIYSKYTNSFNGIIKKALTDVADQIDIEKLVNSFETHRYPSQRILVYTATFDKLKKTNKLDQTAVVTIAFGVKNLSHNKLDTDTDKEVLKLISDLPTSVSNLVSPFYVCIKNTESDEYIYAASDFFKSGNNRRVFTWIPRAKVNQGVWSIDKKVDENKYLIRNFFHVNQTLFVSANEHDNNGRKVFALNPNTSDNLELFTWTIEPSGDNVYIKNTLYNEYLFASENLYDTERRHVYTSMDKNKSKRSLWTIEVCS